MLLVWTWLILAEKLAFYPRFECLCHAIDLSGVGCSQSMGRLQQTEHLHHFHGDQLESHQFTPKEACRSQHLLQYIPRDPIIILIACLKEAWKHSLKLAGSLSPHVLSLSSDDASGAAPSLDLQYVLSWKRKFAAYTVLTTNILNPDLPNSSFISFK